MKKVLAIIISLTALTGCTQFRAATDTLSTLTTGFVDPVTPTNIEQVERGFNLLVRSANKWASYCWSQPYKQITASEPGRTLCSNRRQTRRNLSKYADLANAEILKAEAYIRANPTIYAGDLIQVAWKAVLAYKSLIPVSGAN